ncbi:MAG: hypothetical protein U5K37_08950 [Natrialbaceae archaeon]|nr:hypothetical protein [Natrialbaceae archaeon]
MWTALLFDEAVIRTLQETLPPIVITLFAYLTMLGNIPSIPFSCWRITMELTESVGWSCSSSPCRFQR